MTSCRWWLLGVRSQLDTASSQRGICGFPFDLGRLYIRYPNFTYAEIGVESGNYTANVYVTAGTHLAPDRRTPQSYEAGV
jgi:hypothetical protein